METITSDQIKHNSLTAFLEQASDKWDRGEAEHGGKITDRDCLLELEQEVIDAWFYVRGERIRRADREQYIHELEAEVHRLKQLVDGYEAHVAIP